MRANAVGLHRTPASNGPRRQARRAAPEQVAGRSLFNGDALEIGVECSGRAVGCQSATPMASPNSASTSTVTAARIQAKAFGIRAAAFAGSESVCQRRRTQAPRVWSPAEIDAAFACVHANARKHVRLMGTSESMPCGCRAEISGRFDRCDDGVVVPARRVAEEVHSRSKPPLQHAPGSRDLRLELLRSELCEIGVCQRVRIELPTSCQELVDLPGRQASHSSVVAHGEVQDPAPPVRSQIGSAFVWTLR